MAVKYIISFVTFGPSVFAQVESNSVVRFLAHYIRCEGLQRVADYLHAGGFLPAVMFFSIKRTLQLHSP